jgi:hypothetical protein
MRLTKKKPVVILSKNSDQRLYDDTLWVRHTNQTQERAFSGKTRLENGH